MGIFYNTVPLFNRSPVDLTATFDGQCLTIPAKATVHIPQAAVIFAKNQNPIMGSQSIHNPHVSGARYLVADLSADDTPDNEHAPLTEEEWQEHLGQPQRINAQEAFEDRYAGDPTAKLVTRGKKGKVAAGSKYEAGASTVGTATYEHDPR